MFFTKMLQKNVAVDFMKKNLFEKGENLFLISNSLTYAFDGDFFPKKTSDNTNHVVLVPNWLDRIHEDNFDLKWGQRFLDFPSYTRNLFKKLYPNHPERDLANFGQIVDMRHYQCAFLENLHKKDKIILHDLRKESIEQYEAGKLLEVSENVDRYQLHVDGNKLLSLEKERLGIVVNYLSLPNQLPNDLTQLGFKGKQHTNLYYMSKEHIPENILLTGYGLSAVWVKRDFLNSNLFVITDTEDAKLPKIPANKDVPYDLINLVYYKDLHINEENHLVQVVNKFGEQFVIDYTKDYFTAIGYAPYDKLTSGFPKKHLITPALMTNDEFIAPKNIPIGSLTQRLVMFYARSELYNDLEYCLELQFYVDGILPTIIADRMEKRAIEIDSRFFELLEKNIKQLDSALPRDLELALYADTFRESQKSMSDKKLAAFKAVITQLQDESENRFEHDLKIQNKR